jgi:hypothetical protein
LAESKKDNFFPEPLEKNREKKEGFGLLPLPSPSLF